MVDLSMADQLQYVEQQLSQCQLTPGEQASLDDFRVWSLQFRQQRHHKLGHFPDDMVERSAWQARKQQLDESMEPEMESERLLRGKKRRQGGCLHSCVCKASCRLKGDLSPAGLSQVWLKHQERERLQELRGTMLEGARNGVHAQQASSAAACELWFCGLSRVTDLACLLAGLHDPVSISSHAVPVDMVHHVARAQAQPLQQQIQPDQALLPQQHFMQPDHAMLMSPHLHQQPLTSLSGLSPTMSDPSPPMQLLHNQQEPLAGSSDLQQPALSSQQLPGQASTSYSQQEPAAASGQELAQRKVCRICHEVKPLTDYHRNKVNADGHNSMCKTCAAEYDKEKRRRRQRVHEPAVSEKECPHCKSVKPADGFYRYSLSMDGLYNICKVCHADQAKARQEAKAGMCPPAEKVSKALQAANVHHPPLCRCQLSFAHLLSHQATQLRLTMIVITPSESARSGGAIDHGTRQDQHMMIFHKLLSHPLACCSGTVPQLHMIMRCTPFAGLQFMPDNQAVFRVLHQQDCCRHASQPLQAVSWRQVPQQSLWQL